mmetsp:Transcript_65763/g.132066  ORF Transcript_65763/g.132066 Transcript_65763/m.132066 type:complete len:309 (-) Transcript_65763:18-944(-)
MSGRQLSGTVAAISQRVDHGAMGDDPVLHEALGPYLVQQCLAVAEEARVLILAEVAGPSVLRLLRRRDLIFQVGGVLLHLVPDPMAAAAAAEGLERPVHPIVPAWLTSRAVYQGVQLRPDPHGMPHLVPSGRPELGVAHGRGGLPHVHEGPELDRLPHREGASEQVPVPRAAPGDERSQQHFAQAVVVQGLFVLHDVCEAPVDVHVATTGGVPRAAACKGLPHDLLRWQRLLRPRKERFGSLSFLACGKKQERERQQRRSRGGDAHQATAILTGSCPPPMHRQPWRATPNQKPSCPMLGWQPNARGTT